jgi:integrase
MSPGHLRNCRCYMDRAFEYADHRFGRRRNERALAPEYAELLKLLPDRWERGKLRRLFHFASEQAVAAQDLNDSFFDQFLSHLKRTTLPNPQTVDRETRKLWNRICETVPGWPGRAVTVPSYVDQWVLATEAFPQNLWDELDAYLKRRSAKATVQIDDLLSEVELFGDGGEGPIEAQPIRASTADLIRYRVRQFASALVRTGVMKAEEIVSLKTLVGPHVVNAGLKFFIQRAGGEKQKSQIRGIASDLMMIARLWVRSPESDVAKLRLMVKKTRPEHQGLPESARRSLAPFRDIANVRAFLACPDAIVKDAEREKMVDSVIANRVAAALWMKIAQRAPLRINNLMKTDIQANILRSHTGKDAAVALYYPPDQVKNDKALEVPLSRATVEMLDLYLRKYRPALIDVSSSWLFPTQDGGPKLASVRSADIQKLMRQYIGFSINPHSFRHVAAKLYLTARPGQYEIVQRILGHKSRNTTVKYYCDLEAEEAFKHFDAVLLKLEAPSGKEDR